MKRRRRKSYPLPEAIPPSGANRRGRKATEPPPPWEIEDSRIGAVDLEKRRMLIPTGSDERERLIRAHELGHVKWTPKSGARQAAGLPPAAFQSCEDCRINGLLQRKANIRFDTSVVPDPHTSSRHFADQWKNGEMSDLEAAALLMASRGTADYAPLFDAFYEANPNVTPEIDDRVSRLAAPLVHPFDDRGRSRDPQFSDTLAAARKMASMFRADDSSGDADKLRSPGAEDAGVDGELSELMEELGEKAMNEVEHYYIDRGEGGEWGEMTIEKGRMAIPFPARLKGPSRRATAEGSIFAHPDRMLSDQRVFRTKPRRPGGGTLLIDLSGSMSLTDADVRNIIGAIPAATIAIYAGDNESGILRIIAEKGRRVRDHELTFPFGGNTVDGPALNWLESMPGPRIWVSDGMIVGKAGSTAMDLVEETKTICRRAGIARLPDADAVLEFAQRLQ